MNGSTAMGAGEINLGFSTAYSGDASTFFAVSVFLREPVATFSVNIGI